MNRQEEAKEKGNTAFKSGSYEAAVTHYAEGIEQDPLNKNIVSTLYANKAAANMKLKKFKEALADCDKAIEINDNYAKVQASITLSNKFLGLPSKRRYQDGA